MNSYSPFGFIYIFFTFLIFSNPLVLLRFKIDPNYNLLIFHFRFKSLNATSSSADLILRILQRSLWGEKLEKIRGVEKMQSMDRSQISKRGQITDGGIEVGAIEKEEFEAQKGVIEC
jgi:hypothetical protein